MFCTPSAPPSTYAFKLNGEFEDVSRLAVAVAFLSLYFQSSSDLRGEFAYPVEALSNRIGWCSIDRLSWQRYQALR
jgi:hypothetical protein